MNYYSEEHMDASVAVYDKMTQFTRLNLFLHFPLSQSINDLYW